MKSSVLIVEDDKPLAATLKNYFLLRGFCPKVITDGKIALNFIIANSKKIDIVILDIHLPSLTGLEICHKVRKRNIDTPILMLTKETETNVVINAFNLGANDYVKKPFAIEELEARIQSILKTEDEKEKQTLEFGDIHVFLHNRTVLKGTEEINLRRKEFDLLVFMIQYPNMVLSREKIISNVWVFDREPYLNTVDVHVSCLRKKLFNGSNTLHTVHGVGYMLRG